MTKFEEYKEIIIRDLSKKTNYSSWGAGYYEGLTEGCLVQHDFTEEEKDYLLLKWGAIKEWNLHSKKGKQLLKKYFKTLKAGGLMLYDCTPENKKLICEIIDEANLDKIQLDWTGKWVSKTKAKKYIMEYKE